MKKFLYPIHKNENNIIENYDINDECLECPICKLSDTHQYKTEIFDREDDEEHGTHIITDDKRTLIGKEMKNNPSSRRNGVRIYFYCENEHYFNLNIFQHKGKTYIEYEYETNKK